MTLIDQLLNEIDDYIIDHQTVDQDQLYLNYILKRFVNEMASWEDQDLRNQAPTFASYIAQKKDVLPTIIKAIDRNMSFFEPHELNFNSDSADDDDFDNVLSDIELSLSKKDQR